MGMLDRIQDAAVLLQRAGAIAREEQANPGGAAGSTGAIGYVQPWATPPGTILNRISYAEHEAAFGGQRPAGPVTVAEALRVPAIKKGRAILHAVITSTPLVAIRSVDGVDTTLVGKDAPTWLYRSDTDIAVEQRMAAILDDMLFHEASLLLVERGKAPAGQQRGDILDAMHVPYEWWRVDPEDGTLLINERPADTDQVVWIPAPSAGLLVEARAEIRQWLDIARNIGQRLAVPAPSIILQDNEQDEATDDEILAAVQAVAAARRSPDGAVMYVPSKFTATPVEASDDGRLYVEARNALRIDLANHLNLPVALLDGSPATASLTYSTGEGKRSEFDDLSIDYWTTPIEAALSLDNVVPRGTRTRFDFGSRFAPTNAPTGAPTQD